MFGVTLLEFQQVSKLSLTKKRPLTQNPSSALHSHGHGHGHDWNVLHTDDPGREDEVLDSFPLFLLPLVCTGDGATLRFPEAGLLAERGWDEVGGREPAISEFKNTCSNKRFYQSSQSLTPVNWIRVYQKSFESVFILPLLVCFSSSSPVRSRKNVKAGITAWPLPVVLTTSCSWSRT